MAITKLNSQAIPPNTIIESDLSYPLTNFSSTGIDDNATSTAVTIDANENVGINESSPDELLHVKGPDEVVIKIEATGSQAPTLYDGSPKLQLVPMATNGITGEAIIEAIAPSSFLHGSHLIFRAGKSPNQYDGTNYTGGSFSFHDGNTQVCSISDQGIEAANFKATSGGTTALSLTSTGRVTTGENLEVAGTITSGQIFASDTVTTGSPSNGAADFLSLLNNDTGGNHHIGIKFASADAGGNLRHGAYVTALKDGTWGDGTGSYPMHLTFWTRPASSGVQIERMRIQSNGNVGVGTNSPIAKLDVRGETHTTGIRIKRNDTSGINNPNDDYVTLSLADNDLNFVIDNDADGDAGNYRFFKRAANADVELCRIDSNGNVHADGNVVAYSTTISDERLKDNVQGITGALDTVDALRGVTYTWKQGSREGKRDYGVIAQEVEQVIPEIVHDTMMPLLGDEETVYKTVDYEKLCAVLISAVSELRAEVEELRASRN